MTLQQADYPTQEDPKSPDTEDPDAEIQNQNILDDLTDDQKVELGEQCKKGFLGDVKSRSEWERNLDEWINLAKQVRESKTYPWPGASNVKYPLLATAAMQFAARSYPSLIPSNNKVVNAVVIGKDPTGSKAERADRVSTYMSYQLFEEMDHWEEDMDKMLMMLPIVGTMFKKTWYDKADDKIKSCLILPKQIVVNYWAKSLEDVERISEVIFMSPRILKERQNQKIYADVDLGPPEKPASVNHDEVADDDTIPYTIIEQHTFYDKDGDGYAEPYIVTFEKESGKLLRVTPRYHLDDVVRDGKKVVSIKPMQMYTKFGFVPNPDGSFYDIGFGVLLGPLNESVNTLINLQIDAGHLATLQSGFIGKGLRLKPGENKFQPGEWKIIAGGTDDMRKQILPLPVKEPSNVLFELMGSLITSGKELASVAEIFVGKMPGQNTPATTTMASIEQGMKVFTAVYKRIFRALSEEFDKIFELNKLYLDPNTYVKVIDTQIGPDDFNSEDCDIVPGADPTAVSQTEKLLKAQGVMEILPMIPGLLDPVEAVSRVFIAQEQPNWQKLFSQQVQQTGQLPPPPPDPKIMAIQAKMQADQQSMALETQQTQQEMELKARDRQQQMAMDAQEHAQNMQFQQQEAQTKAAADIAMANTKIATAQAQAKQSLQQNSQMHQQKMAIAKEQAKSSQNNSSKSGNKTR